MLNSCKQYLHDKRPCHYRSPFSKENIKVKKGTWQTSPTIVSNTPLSSTGTVSKAALGDFWRGVCTDNLFLQLRHHHALKLRPVMGHNALCLNHHFNSCHQTPACAQSSQIQSCALRDWFPPPPPTSALQTASTGLCMSACPRKLVLALQACCTSLNRNGDTVAMRRKWCASVLAAWTWREGKGKGHGKTQRQSKKVMTKHKQSPTIVSFIKRKQILSTKVNKSRTE